MIKNIELELKHNSAFIGYLFSALCIELILINLGIPSKLMPNFVMCIVFSFAYVKPVPLWLVGLGVLVGESFFSSTPNLMIFMILSLYFFVTFMLKNPSNLHKNFHMITFMLITLVIYSVKILWLFASDFRPDVSYTLVKMIVTILLFPLFYFTAEKIVAHYS
jgi:hypothetical protein